MGQVPYNPMKSNQLKKITHEEKLAKFYEDGDQIDRRIRAWIAEEELA
jgi:hypothetical protein